MRKQIMMAMGVLVASAAGFVFAAPQPKAAKPAKASSVDPALATLQRQLAQFAPVTLSASALAMLPPNEQQALAEILAAARLMNPLSVSYTHLSGANGARERPPRCDGDIAAKLACAAGD